MDKISSLINDQDVSLDCVLAFIDSTDFDLLTTNDQDMQVKNTEVFDWNDIQDALTSTPLTLLDNQEIFQLRDPVPQTQDNDSHPSELVRSAASRQLNGCVAPYKEHGRVRDRVVRLRGMVKQLEQQLESLNSIKYQVHADESKDGVGAMNDNSNTGKSDAPPTSDIDVVTWHQLALRQFQARREAEKENFSLRERLEEQIRLARRMENLIRGQLPQQMLLEIHEELRNQTM